MIDMIKKQKYIWYIFFPLLLTQLVLGAGGGGGGSSKPSIADCPQDTWSCTSWTACQKDGTQARTCKLVDDCPNVDTPKPIEKAFCTYVSELVASLKCTNLGSLKQRVDCRLGLTDIDLRRELQIAYLPEECRYIKDSDEKDDCVKVYSQSQPCWKFPIGEKRVSCLRQVLGIKYINEEKESCANNDKCINILRKKVYALIKFRFYDLEERAEELYEDGKITKEKAVDIISQLEQQKVKFNTANSKEQRKQVILDTKELWKNFVASIGVS